MEEKDYHPQTRKQTPSEPRYAYDSLASEPPSEQRSFGSEKTRKILEKVKHDMEVEEDIRYFERVVEEYKNTKKEPPISRRERDDLQHRAAALIGGASVAASTRSTSGTLSVETIWICLLLTLAVVLFIYLGVKVYKKWKSLTEAVADLQKPKKTAHV